MKKIRLVIATRNDHKFSEFQKLFKGTDIELISLKNYPDVAKVTEDGNSYDENALKKGMAAFRVTNEITLADDSGLNVDCLNGNPGIYSSRYAGEEGADYKNNLKLLEEMKDIPMDKRMASFNCSIAVIDTAGDYYITHGRCNGYVSTEMKGANGFGYDPLFIIPQYNKTFAELGDDMKCKISHRAIAIKKTFGFILTLKKKISKPDL